MAVQNVKATINGQTYTLEYDSSSDSWKATITAPAKSSYPLSGHYYPVTVSATDDADNTTTVNSSDSTFGESCRLQVKEKVKPVITVTSPTAGSTITNSSPTITWKITDDDSGVNPDTIKIKIDSGSAVSSGITKTMSDANKTYTCSYAVPSALADGSHTFTLSASDYDGNAATEVSTTFKIDTVPPTLTVTSPANNLITNRSKVTVAGTTNDVTSSPVTLTVNGVSVTVGSNGAFSYEYTLTKGINTITIVATDSAGKSTTVTRTVTLDTDAPVFQSITIAPNPVDAGKTYVITVKVTDE